MNSVGEILYGRKRYRVRDGDQLHLDRVAHAAADVQAADAGLTQAIRSAHEADISLRAIAAAANLSHEQVRRIARGRGVESSSRYTQ